METEEKDAEKDKEGAFSSDHGGSGSYSASDHATEPELDLYTLLKRLKEDPPVVHSVSDKEKGEVEKVTAKKVVILLSLGSALHAEGRCRPCAFFRSEIGCRAKESCRFCHCEHVITRQLIPFDAMDSEEEDNKQDDTMDSEEEDIKKDDAVDSEEEDIKKDRDSASSTDHGGSESYSASDHTAEPFPELGTELLGFGYHPPQNVDLDEDSAKKAFTWSLGSALHEEGTCRPCAFVRSDVGCRAKESCRFCHYEHVITRQRLRPCKGKRIRIHKLLERLKYEVDEYIASGRPMFGLSDHLSSLELPPMVQTNETLKKTVFAQTLIHMEETYGFRLVESL